MEPNVDDAKRDDGVGEEQLTEPSQSTAAIVNALSVTESIIVCFVLVMAFHAIPYWLLGLLPARQIYESLGPKNYANFWDALSLLLPLTLCLTAPRRSGLRLGAWSGKWRKLGFIMLVPIGLVAVVNPFTSQPFKDVQIGTWLISPAAQDMLFSGYIYGIFVNAMGQGTSSSWYADRASLITAMLFSMWHIPNFLGFAATFVVFQLIYTFLFALWILRVRRLTGSLIPVVATHMGANFIGWVGW